ncbi:MAG: ABC transporter permease, partial [Solirubrobacterales bacterium]|nr:ABC transporter permease [Solirubrobacterales bacterium]
MSRVALKGLLGRRTRALLTAIAIVLGVAMVSGTYILTDTIKAAFSTVFTRAYKNADAVVTGKSAVGTDSNNAGAAVPRTLPASLLTRIRALPQVALAAGAISDTAGLIGHDGKVISRGGAPNLAFSHTAAGARFSPLTLSAGRYPTRPHEIAIDAETASKQNFAIGQQIGVVARGPVQRFEIVGTVNFGGVSSLGGATIAIFSLPTARRIFHKQGQLDQINVAARHGVSPEQLVHTIRPLLPPNSQV